MKKHIHIRGPLLTMSGYGVHARQIFKWALQNNHTISVSLTPWGITPWYCNKDDLDGLVGEIMERSAPPIMKPDISFQVQLPNEWDPNVANVNVGVSAVVESTFCNPSWVKDCEKMNAVIVPSEFAKSALVNSGLNPEKATVIPESYHEACDNKNSFDLHNVKTKFNFLLFGQITGNVNSDRKNTFNTVSNFCKTFKDNPEVGLVLKTNMGRNCAIDRRVTIKSIKNLIKTVREGDFPKIYLLHGALTESEVAGLHKNPKIKALISGTRGEGFGLPMLEAAACNLPVIATNWSAHTEFLNHGKWLNVNYKLNKIPDSRVDQNVWMQNSFWADFDEKHFSERISKFYKGSSIPQDWSTKLGVKIREKYSQKAINSLYSNFLEKLL